MKLNIGCGGNYREGYLNCDLHPRIPLDRIMDFNDPWPFPDNSTEEVLLKGVIQCADSLIFIMNECWRVLEPGGILRIWHVCVRPGDVAPFREPTAKHYYSEQVFDFFAEERLNPGCLTYARDCGFKGRFRQTHESRVGEANYFEWEALK